MRPRTLRFFPDYYADPVWTPDGAMISLGDLPISDDLRRELRAWAAEWTRTATDDIKGKPLSDDEEAALDARGAAGCARLRAELGDGWEIASDSTTDS